MRHLLWSSLLLVCVGCGAALDGPGGGEGGGETFAGTCSSDSWWTRGNAGSSLMRPGGDCIGCHKDMGEGPRYDVAGTVYREYDEPDDCDGAMDVVIEVTGADGQVFRDVSNSAGNFYFRDRDLQFPATTRVIEGGKVLEMVGEIEHGNCATCHTADGREGAPGRVVTPE